MTILLRKGLPTDFIRLTIIMLQLKLQYMSVLFNPDIHQNSLQTNTPEHRNKKECLALLSKEMMSGTTKTWKMKSWGQKTNREEESTVTNHKRKFNQFTKSPFITETIVGCILRQIPLVVHRLLDMLWDRLIDLNQAISKESKSGLMGRERKLYRARNDKFTWILSAMNIASSLKKAPIPNNGAKANQQRTTIIQTHYTKSQR